MQRLVIAPDQFVDASRVSLTAAQRHYLLSVLRLRLGDRLIVLDGAGQGWLAELTAEMEAQLLEPYVFKTELAIPVKLMAALPKNGFDEVVRCCTELGVTHIYPLIAERTILKPSDNKLKRWQKIALEAAEQSERAIVPEIFAPQSFTEALASCTAEQSYFCAARAGSVHLLRALPSTIPTSITVFIGAEGGWTDLEIQQAIARGIPLVSLGASILRAVTASITALSLINGYLNIAGGQGDEA